MKNYFFCFFVAILIGSKCFANVIYYYSSPIENAANTISNGMVQSATQGALYNGIMQKAAEKRALARKVERVRGCIASILQGYTKEQHKKYMKLLENSPDISYSLKVGLINNCNAYRTARDSIDTVFEKRYHSWAEGIDKVHEASLRELLSLLSFFNPHEKSRKVLNKEIDKIGLAKDIREELNNLIKDYYSARNEIDTVLLNNGAALTEMIAE